MTGQTTESSAANISAAAFMIEASRSTNGLKLRGSTAGLDDQPSANPPPTAAIKKRPHGSGSRRGRLPHNVVERRYRKNLNGQIEALQLSLPSPVEDCLACSDIEDGLVMSKTPSKASIIATAVAYIKELESINARLRDDATALKEEVSQLQRLMRCDDCSVMKYVASLSADSAAVPHQ